MEIFSEQEKEYLIKEQEKRENRVLRRGKMLVYMIAIIHILLTVINNIFGDFSLLNIAIQVALSIALVKGVRWVKCFFVVKAPLAICFFFYIFATIQEYDPMHIWMWGYIFLCFAFEIASGALLAFHKGIREFLYEQYTKR